MDTMRSISEVAITIGADWGCDHTDDDGRAYAAFVDRWFAARGVPVCADYDPGHLGRDTIDSDKYTEDDVRAMLQQCWEAFCAADWPRA